MDALSSLLISLNNARLVRKKRIAVPYSTLASNLARFLQEKGIIAKIREQAGPPRKLIITLAYAGTASRLHGIKRLSRPGQRRYASHRELPYVYDGVGFIIISTSRGLVDDATARREKVGGELLCEVW